MTTHPIPRRDEFTENEILVKVIGDKPDARGRIRFAAYWHDTRTPAEGGPPDGVHGQVCFTDLDRFIADAERAGDKVRRCP